MEPFRTVRQTSGSYPVWVGRGLLDLLGELVDREGQYGGIALLFAKGIEASWGDRIRTGLGDRATTTITFHDSEERKTLQTAEEIVTGLLDAGAGRDWLAVIAGGGSAGDTGGFAASIFMRGIPYVHVPTTLLAQVDSSLGGKLGVNHAAGKNLIGVFAPPAAVVADLDTLSTLPKRQLRSGLYEALKGGILGDRVLFELMEQRAGDLSPKHETLDEIVARAIDVKISVVTDDEREGDRRRLLNYGHTIGHGFEGATGYSVLTHGDAVAWGMIAANTIARARGLIDSETTARLERVILSYEPDALPEMSRSQILSAIGHDKKFRQGRRVMVLPVEIGRCEVFEDITADEIELGIDAALSVSSNYDARA